jgi:ADP-L-glycero-D-manno-heptose 6-epimerase
MWIVTGANGFIGSAIVGELNQRGYDELVLVDTVPVAERPHLLEGKTFRRFLQTDELVPFLKNENRLAGIIHMGACSSTTEKNVEFLRRNNTEYTRTLWEICRDKGAPFIYASSGATYGGGQFGFDDKVTSELYQPLNPYGWSKLNFDTWAEKETVTPPNWYGLRFFNVFGPNEEHKGEMSSVVFKAFHQIRTTGRLQLFKSHRSEYNDGEQLRDFVYVKDIIRWITELMKNPNMTSGIYNMGFGQARTWIDLARAVFKEVHRPMDIDWIEIPEHIRDQYQYRTEAKMEKWLMQGGSPAEWSLEKAINDYIKGFLAQGKHL